MCGTIFSVRNSPAILGYSVPTNPHPADAVTIPAALAAKFPF